MVGWSIGAVGMTQEMNDLSTNLIYPAMSPGEGNRGDEGVELTGT